MRTVVRRLVLLSVIALMLQSTHAQVGPSVDLGVRVGTDIAGDVEEEYLGVDARIGLTALPVVINPAFDYYFTPDPVDFFQLSVNALLSVSTMALPTISPYVGGGLGIARTSAGAADDTDIGINLVGGGAINVGSIKPFAQVQLTLGTPDLVTVAVGVHFRVTG